jgi:hypothetical protein
VFVVKVQGDSELPEVVDALDSTGRLAGGTERRQKKCSQGNDDGCRCQKFKDGKSVPNWVR